MAARLNSSRSQRVEFSFLQQIPYWNLAFTLFYLLQASSCSGCCHQQEVRTNNNHCNKQDLWTKRFHFHCSHNWSGKRWVPLGDYVSPWYSCMRKICTELSCEGRQTDSLAVFSVLSKSGSKCQYNRFMWLAAFLNVTHFAVCINKTPLVDLLGHETINSAIIISREVIQILYNKWPISLA